MQDNEEEEEVLVKGNEGSSNDAEIFMDVVGEDGCSMHGMPTMFWC